MSADKFKSVYRPTVDQKIKVHIYCGSPLKIRYFTIRRIPAIADELQTVFKQKTTFLSPFSKVCNKWVQKMSLMTTLQLHNLVQSKRNDHLIPKLIKLNTKLHLAEAWPEAGQKTFSGCLSPPCSCSVYARGLKLAAHIDPTSRLHIEVKQYNAILPLKFRFCLLLS